MKNTKWLSKVQNSKILKIFLIAVVLFFSFESSRSHAIGLDTAVKIVAGSSAQKVVRSIGEKAGIKYSEASLKATTDYINGQAAKGNQKYIDLAKGINTAAGTGIDVATKPGWKKYLLDPVMWLTGADLLVEAYDAFNDAKNGGYDVDVYSEDYQTNGYSCRVLVQLDKQYAELKHASLPENTMLHSEMSYTSAGKLTCDVYKKAETSTTITIVFKSYLNGVKKTEKEFVRNHAEGDTYRAESLKTRPALDVDLPDITNNTNYDTYRNTIDNDDYSRVTYDNDIEIYAPDTDTTYNNDYTTPWNTKMDDEEFNIIVKPIQDVDVIVPPSDDDDDLPTGKRPDPVEVLDRSMLDVAKKTYDYLGDSIDTAIVSMKDVTDNATGLISYLDESFDWLPAEWRALFGSAFILGVFAHFFRR